MQDAFRTNFCAKDILQAGRICNRNSKACSYEMGDLVEGGIGTGTKLNVRTPKEKLLDG